MIINYQSSTTPKRFLMMSYEIDDELSPQAYILLVKYMKLAPSQNNSNKVMKEKTGYSKKIFDRAKKELVEKGYLETKQLRGNRYALYIGKEMVVMYKRYKKKDNSYEQNELKRLKKEFLESISEELSKFRWSPNEPIYNRRC